MKLIVDEIDITECPFYYMGNTDAEFMRVHVTLSRKMIKGNVHSVSQSRRSRMVNQIECNCSCFK